MRPAPALSPQQQLPHRNTVARTSTTHRTRTRTETQGLRVVLQTSANSTGASQTGTLTRPLRLGTKVRQEDLPIAEHASIMIAA